MIIVGNGRVGGSLKRKANRLGVPATLVSRNSGWESIDIEEGGPIMVCTNADDLAGVLEATPGQRRGDLVFVQNGMLDTFLDAEGCGGNTRGLLYFAAPARGIEPQPGGVSIFSGPHALAMVEFFQALELEARSVPPLDFANEMASKLIWNCVFGLLSDTLNLPVGEICRLHRSTVETVTDELVSVCNAGIQTTLRTNETVEGLVAYSMSIPNYQGALKQWRWRNGWFAESAQRLGIETPTHDKFLVGRRPDGR